MTKAVKLCANRKRGLFLGNSSEGDILVVEVRESFEGK